MAQARTQKGAIKQLQQLLANARHDLQMAWAKTNPTEAKRIAELQIAYLENQLAPFV